MTAKLQALSTPRCLERICSFLDETDEERFLFLGGKSALEFVNKNKDPDRNVYFNYRYPFYDVHTVAKAQEVYKKLGPQHAVAYLREIEDDLIYAEEEEEAPTEEVAAVDEEYNPINQEPRTAVWRTFFTGKEDLAELYLSWGGRFTLLETQERFLADNSMPPVVAGHPRISACIRLAKWTFTPDNDKQALLQTTLEHAADKADLAALEWVKKKWEPYNFSSLILYPAMKMAVESGHAVFIVELCKWLDPKKLSASQKKSMVETCVELGYPDLLQVLSVLDFPVTIQQKTRMETLKQRQASLAPLVVFPQPISALQNESRGGDRNKTTREKEYACMVGYVCHYIENNGGFHQLLENLLPRRRRMANLCGIITTTKDGVPNDQYGIPTNMMMITQYSGYSGVAEAILARYKDSLPCHATVEINDLFYPLTQFFEDRWEHPDGAYREQIMEEIGRICEMFRPPVRCSDDLFRRRLLKVAFLISHMPPSLRGTPIIMRAFIDGICLMNKRKPIDSAFEVNCHALTFRTVEEHAEDGMEKFKLEKLEEKGS